LADEKPNPRIVIMYLNRCVEKAIAYYADNPDQTLAVILDDEHEYPLFKREMMTQAYGELTKILWQHIETYDQPQWNKYIVRFRAEKGKTKTFRGAYFQNLLRADEKETQAFMTYMQHIGCLRCTSGVRKDFDKNVYSLPLLLLADAFY
jgi:hypothetical protein